MHFIAPLVFFAALPVLLFGQQGGDVRELDPFEVQTDEVVGYGVSTLTTATRMNTPLVNIPNTISVVTADFMNDIAVFDFKDAIAYMPAMMPRQNIDDGSKIRGLRTTRTYQNNFLVPSYPNDMVKVERVEVIKGPVSAVTGRGEPGGVVNYITKRPLKTPRNVVQARTGSDDYYRMTFDSTGPLSEEHGLYYRVIGLYHNANLWRPFETVKRVGIFPSVYWEINENTNILIEGEAYRTKDPRTFGGTHLTVSEPGRPDLRGNNPTAEQYRAAGFTPNQWLPHRFQGSESWNKRDQDIGVIGVSANHRFNDIVSFRAAFIGVSRESDERIARISNVFEVANQAFIDAGSIQGVSVGDILLPRSAGFTELSIRQWATQGDLLFAYDFDGFLQMSNQTMLSYEFTGGKTDVYEERGTLTHLNVNNPIYGARGRNFTRVADRVDRGETEAYFFSHQSGFFNERLILTYGYRYDSNETSRLNRANNAFSESSPPSTTASRYGILVKPFENLSLYYVNSDQADPENTQLRFSNLPVGDPRANETITFARTGELNEVGFKSELFNGRVSLTGALFKIEQAGFLRNTQDQDPDTGVFFTRNFLVDGSVFEGWEIEAYGTLWNRLSFVGGVSRIKTQTEADPDQVAAGRLENRGVPRYKVSMFGKYQFHESQEGLYLKGGFVIRGPQFSSLENAYLQPSTTVLNLGGGYSWGNHNIDLMLNNITNEIAPRATVAPGSNDVAPPFQWFLTYTNRF